MSVAVLNDTHGYLNGKKHLPGVQGHKLEEINEDDINPSATSEGTLEAMLNQLPKLGPAHLQVLSSAAIARQCLQRQEENLHNFVEDFATWVDADFKVTQPELWKSLVDTVKGMKVKITEQALESTSSREGTLTITLPGLPEGVNVTKSRDCFFVNEGATLLERNQVRVKMGGLDVYSGYWLATDTPSNSIEDPLQEEGIDTLRRVMEAAGIPLSSDVFEDPLEYPFLSALLAPFGPGAIAPFEEHLRSLHSEWGHKHGGSWFKMTSARKARSKLEQVDEIEGGEGDESAQITEEIPVPAESRWRLTDAEEADLELEKLDL